MSTSESRLPCHKLAIMDDFQLFPELQDIICGAATFMHANVHVTTVAHTFTLASADGSPFMMQLFPQAIPTFVPATDAPSNKRTAEAAFQPHPEPTGDAQLAAPHTVDEIRRMSPHQKRQAGYCTVKACTQPFPIGHWRCDRHRDQVANRKRNERARKQAPKGS